MVEAQRPAFTSALPELRNKSTASWPTFPVLTTGIFPDEKWRAGRGGGGIIVSGQSTVRGGEQFSTAPRAEYRAANLQEEENVFASVFPAGFVNSGQSFGKVAELKINIGCGYTHTVPGTIPPTDTRDNTPRMLLCVPCRTHPCQCRRKYVGTAYDSLNVNRLAQEAVRYPRCWLPIFFSNKIAIARCDRQYELCLAFVEEKPCILPSNHHSSYWLL